MENYYFDRYGVYIGSAAASAGTVPPKNATRTPPVLEQGTWPVFDRTSQSWHSLPDFRGRTGWVGGQAVTIASLGPLPDGWSDVPPTSPAVTTDDGNATGAQAEAGTLVYLTNSGVYHRRESCARGKGSWLSLDEIRAGDQAARPCGRCRPPE